MEAFHDIIRSVNVESCGNELSRNVVSEKEKGMLRLYARPLKIAFPALFSPITEMSASVMGGLESDVVRLYHSHDLCAARELSADHSKLRLRIKAKVRYR